MQRRYHTRFALAIVDIDHFRVVNDKHGHLQGDHKLVEFARKLEETARETDLLARYGGEEFVIIMPETDLAGAGVFAERLREKVERELDLTVSYGVSAGLKGDTLHSLLSRADTALYSAKAAGRNCGYQHTGRQIEQIQPANPTTTEGPCPPPKTRRGNAVLTSPDVGKEVASAVSATSN
jgi:diguanylate cyclase (GGDEF)-like protein